MEIDFIRAIIHLKIADTLVYQVLKKNPMWNMVLSLFPAHSEIILIKEMSERCEGTYPR
jgi:hypothetical protein